MKKPLKFLVAIVFVTLLSANVFAYDFVVDGIYYNINSDGTTVSVTNNGNNPYSGSISIPSTIIYNTISYSVTNIGESAFYGCTGLISVTIPNSVTSIGNSAFEGCTGLTSVTIPENVAYIGERTFADCTGLTTINYNARSCYIFYTEGDFSTNWLSGCGNITTVNIGNEVTYIPHYFVYGEPNITSIVIPNSVETIGGFAFWYCTGLTSVNIPNSVTTVSYSSFNHCTGLTSVTIGSGVTSIGWAAFGYCTGLTSVNIPNSVETIDGNAFENCSSLTSVTIGDNVEIIGEGAFQNCTSLTSINIPNSVTSVGNNAFQQCTSLSILQIGVSVDNIGNKAFYKCSALDSIYCRAQEPPVLGSAVFGSTDRSTIILTVPCGKQSAYQAADGWSLFANIEEDCHDSYLNDVAEENSISLYPNPAKENITLTADEDIFIYNNLGQIVKQINNPKGETTINISDLQNGVYYIKSGNRQQKLIKE